MTEQEAVEVLIARANEAAQAMQNAAAYIQLLEAERDLWRERYEKAVSGE